MSDITITPQIEAILDELAGLCCEALDAEGTLNESRVGKLVQALSTNGWERHSDESPPLGAIIEKRVLSRCKEPSMHRGAALDALVGEVQQKYDAVKPDSAKSPQ
ncbi:MAG: hypothetical protein WBD20_23400 [Pirellulaceae bacterium]